MRSNLADRHRIERDEVVFHGELDEFSVALEVQYFHYAIFVESDGTRGQGQYGSDFLHRLTFSQELQNFDLTRSQSLFRRFGFAGTDKGFVDKFLDFGSHIGAAAQNLTDALQQFRS